MKTVQNMQLMLPDATVTAKTVGMETVRNGGGKDSAQAMETLLETSG
jgi:hypothetical protein